MRPDFKIKSMRIIFSKWFTCMYLLMFFMLIAAPGPSFSQSCDPKIKPIQNEKLKYRTRDNNRCEGFYSSLVSVEMIDVVGVTKGGFYFKTSEDEILELSSPTVNDRAIYIRAVGVPLKVYYRMDAHLDARQTLTWPMGDVVYLRKLSSMDICVFGWTGNETDKIYIPVAAASKLSPISNDGKIHLYLRASVDVTNVQWRAAGTYDNLEDAGYKSAPKPSYSAGKPIEIILPSMDVEEWCVEVAAKNQKTAQWLKKKDIRVRVGEK